MELYEQHLLMFLGHLEEEKSILECHCKEIHLALRRLETRELREKVKKEKEKIRQQEEFKSSVNDFSQVDELIRKAESVFTRETFKPTEECKKALKTSAKEPPEKKTQRRINPNQARSKHFVGVKTKTEGNSGAATAKTKATSTKAATLHKNRRVLSASSEVQTTARTKTHTPANVASSSSAINGARINSSRKSLQKTMPVRSNSSIHASGGVIRQSREGGNLQQKKHEEAIIQEISKEILKTSNKNNSSEKVRTSNTPPEDEKIPSPFTPDFTRIYTQSCRQIKNLKITESRMCKENSQVRQTFLDNLQKRGQADDMDTVDESNKIRGLKGLYDYLSHCGMPCSDVENIIKEVVEIRNEANRMLEKFLNGKHGSLLEDSKRLCYYPGRLQESLSKHFITSLLDFLGRSMQLLTPLLKDIQEKDERHLSKSEAIRKYRLLHALSNDCMSLPVIVVDHSDSDDDESDNNE